MLGFIAEASYANTEIELREGDLILLYTDGITEARNPEGEFFDDERVRQWLTAADGGNAARFTDGALRDLSEWRGHAPFEDDVRFVGNGKRRRRRQRYNTEKRSNGGSTEKNFWVFSVFPRCSVLLCFTVPFVPSVCRAGGPVADPAPASTAEQAGPTTGGQAMKVR
jgi:hypothetical protein